MNEKVHKKGRLIEILKLLYIETWNYEWILFNS